MGVTLPKPVESTVVEQYGAKGFSVGIAEMNGWRNNMEDAHLVHIKENWGFFGVFDGHGGDACSKFVAKRLQKALDEGGCPEDDAALKKIIFEVDQEFLDSEQSSGSTATMCIVHKPETTDAKHRLRVANIGDSRILLGRRDGTIVDGGGTDGGLTTDHKPNYPEEKERILRCGGTVEAKEGNVARVNGDLAVSRAFGDQGYKKTGGPGPEDRPVTCNPELRELECQAADFLLLVCDGVSEGQFPNCEEVQLVAEELRAGADPGEAAQAVCHRALETESKDNISCMVVLLSSADFEGKKVEFVPGPILALDKKPFKTAYTCMAEKANFTLAQAVEKRYELLQEKIAAQPDAPYPATVMEELAKIGDPTGTKGSSERANFFEKWVEALPEEEGDGTPSLSSFMSGLGGGLGGGGAPKGGGKGSKVVPETKKEEDEEEYSWSQQGEEIQILFKLPKPASKKEVNVTFKPSTLQVAVHGQQLLDGSLEGKVEVETCTWCLSDNGAELQVMLTKMHEKEWNSLLK